MAKKTIEENVLVFPHQLHFQEDRNNQFKNDHIIISSAWLHGIAYQIIPSRPNLFEIASLEGYVPPCESRKISVTFHSSKNQQNLTCSFTVNIAEASDRDLIDDNPDLFWRMNPKFFSKTLSCEIKIRQIFTSSTEIEADANISPPKGHILELMIKNVSKNSPLLPEEAEELNSIRVVMSKENWNQWLKYARDEKKKRNLKSTSYPTPPQASSVNSLKDDHQIIHATQAAVQTAYSYQTNETIKSMESSKSQHNSSGQPTTHIGQSSEAIPDFGSSRPRGHAVKTSTPVPVEVASNPLIPHSYAATSALFSSSSSHSSIMPPFPPSTSNSTTISMPISKVRSSTPTPALGESMIPKRSSVPSPPSFTQPNPNAALKSTLSSPQAFAHMSPNIPKSPKSPNDSNPVMKSSTSMTINYRMSTPAEKITEPGGNHFLAKHSHENHRPKSSLIGNKESISHTGNGKGEGVSRTEDPTPSSVSPRLSDKKWNSSSNLTSSIDRLTDFNYSEQHPYPSRRFSISTSVTAPSQVPKPSSSAVSVASAPVAHVAHVAPVVVPAHVPPVPVVEIKQTPLVPTSSSQNIPDIVKSSTLRIESAFAAAQSLKASLEADLESDSTNSEKAFSTLAMVNAMLTSLEKSKNSLNTLAHENNSKKIDSSVVSQHNNRNNHIHNHNHNNDSQSNSNSNSSQHDLTNTTKVKRYQNIFGKMNPHHSVTANSIDHHSHDNILHHDTNKYNNEQRFDLTDTDIELTYPSNGHKSKQQDQNPDHDQGNEPIHTHEKWRGESIGIDSNFEEEEMEQQQQQQEEEDGNSEISAIEASDWPPPGNSKFVISPKKRFISVEERLRPQSGTASTTGSILSSQRSVSTSRIDSKRRNQTRVMTKSTISNQSQEDYGTNTSFDENFIISRKKSLLSTDRQNAPHYFLKSRHDHSSNPSGPRTGTGTGTGTLSSSSSAHVSKKTIHTVRHAKGMPRVVRLCISHGPMIKTYDDNPLRIDVENCTLDVVWRERHVYGPDKRTSHNGIQTASTLRRERYTFDDVYTGPDSSLRLSSYTKRRIKTSLLNSRGIVFLCLAGGDFGVNSTAYLEPPMSIILGDSGGQGLISSVLDEIFKYKSKYNGSNSNPPPPPHRLYTGSGTPMRRFHETSSPSRSLSRAASSSPSASSSHLFSNDYVLFSALMISERQVMDLLGSPHSHPHTHSSSSSSSAHQKPSLTSFSKSSTKISQKSDGSYTINHITRLQLRSVADFERIAGVLLGRRAALRELTSLLFQLNTSSPAETVMSHHDVSLPDIPWLLATENESCILFTLTTTGEGVSMSSHGNINYYFTCPCGKYWSLPGSEICLLAEAVSGLPHQPPPSLYQAGEITKLLVDPHVPDMDYITIASVGNQRKDSNHHKVSLEEDEEMIQNALQSFRVVSQLSSIT